MLIPGFSIVKTKETKTKMITKINVRVKTVFKIKILVISKTLRWFG